MTSWVSNPVCTVYPIIYHLPECVDTFVVLYTTLNEKLASSTIIIPQAVWLTSHIPRIKSAAVSIPQ